MIVDVVTTKSPKNRTVLTFLLALANLMSFSVGIITAAILSRYMDVVEYGTYRQVIFIYTTLLVVFQWVCRNVIPIFSHVHLLNMVPILLSY